jgi:hypothetical protein
MKKKRLLFSMPWLLVAALCMPLVGCSSDDDDEPVEIRTYKFEHFKIYGCYQVGFTNWNPSCWKIWPKNGISFNVYLAQNGRICDAGIVHSNDTTLTSSERNSKSLPFNVGIPASFNKDAAVDVIAFSEIESSLSGGNIECKADLRRTGVIPLYAYTETSSVDNVCKSNSFTIEILAIENATSDSIAVKHKGFEAKDKWYYSKAKVIFDADKKITTKGSVGEDAVSDIHKVASGDTAKIWSYYVPNGKKMKDARLVMEINGKEVKTSAISSDVDIEFGKHYRMHLLWNGNSLKWKTSNTETRGLKGKDMYRKADIITCDGSSSGF